MTSTTIDETVLKSDSIGRVRVPAEHRESLLDEFERSGVSGMKFAALIGVKYPTFAGWLQQRRKAREGESNQDLESEQPQAGLSRLEKPLRLLEAVAEVGGTESGVGLRIELPGGAKVAVESPGQLRLAVELLQMLNQPGRRGC